MIKDGQKIEIPEENKSKSANSCLSTKIYVKLLETSCKEKPQNK